MTEQSTPQQISVAEIATAIGTENLVLRLVQLQRQVEEMNAELASLRRQCAAAEARHREHHMEPLALPDDMLEPEEAPLNGR